MKQGGSDSVLKGFPAGNIPADGDRLASSDRMGSQ